ncbi:hypothetical protein D030_1515B, partial [Vibrio parahaemolyticus AQ3810]
SHLFACIRFRYFRCRHDPMPMRMTVCSDISRWQTCAGLSPQVRQRCSV